MAGTYEYQDLIPESVSQVTATNTVALGTHRTYGGCEYLYVYNASTSTALIGCGVVLSAYSAYSVTASAITATPGDLCIGVVQSNDLQPANYGWVLVKGEAHIYSVNAIATRKGVRVAADGAFEIVTSGSTGGANATCGITLSNITSAGTGVAFMNCAG